MELHVSYVNTTTVTPKAASLHMRINNNVHPTKVNFGGHLNSIDAAATQSSLF